MGCVLLLENQDLLNLYFSVSSIHLSDFKMFLKMLNCLFLQVKFNEAVNKVVQAKEKVIEELRNKEKQMEEELKANKGWWQTK